ncbi:MAG: flagellar FlbD family protein [Ruminiclostridium sp.]|nr:flagellar FlbD family protein [Ruminiclostridium sp.]MDE7280521.1 flagellar FlbD family protein [Ruminiclostridium sp.]
MIFLTKLGGKRFILNEDNIEAVTQNPDTIVVLNNGHSYIVQESMDEIMESVIAFNRNSRRSLSRRNGDLNSD